MRPLALLVALCLLAGCAQLRRDLESDPVPEFSARVPWALSGCQLVIAVVPADPAAFADRIPPGFRVLGVNEIPGLPAQDTRQAGNLGVEAFRCASASGLNASANVSDASYGSVFAFVEPPRELRDANATHHFLKWDVLVADPALREALRAEGVNATDGNATFSRFQDVGPGRLFQAAARMANDTFEFEGGSGAAADAEAFSFVEFTPVGDRLVRWRANVTSSGLTGGAGFLASDGPGWASDVLGSRAQAYLLSGGGDLAGEILVPSRA